MEKITIFFIAAIIMEISLVTQGRPGPVGEQPNDSLYPCVDEYPPAYPPPPGPYPPQVAIGVPMYPEGPYPPQVVPGVPVMYPPQGSLSNLVPAQQSGRSLSDMVPTHAPGGFYPIHHLEGPQDYPPPTDSLSDMVPTHAPGGKYYLAIIGTL
ncbi:calcium-binding protein P-like [Adelges cooleyi]|uniref:calcium-binding protein P-like n=1 Tax=Adelges cooleyi TaxID=133065 RepID=UPI00217F6C11|nr:calcium-binding protein P-like [Adelges cooleyi]